MVIKRISASQKLFCILYFSTISYKTSKTKNSDYLNMGYLNRIISDRQVYLQAVSTKFILAKHSIQRLNAFN